MEFHSKLFSIANQLPTRIPMPRITDKALKAKPGSTHQWLYEVVVWGHGSLVARITPGGDRLFYFQYIASEGKRCVMPIGTYGTGENGSMTLADAREHATELANLHKSGIRDIREHLEAEEAAKLRARELEMERQAARKAAREAEKARLAARKTVRDLFEHWARVDLINRKDKGAEVRRMFEKDVLPRLGDLIVEEVRKGHLTEVTDALLARGVNRMAKLVFSLMRQMFRFAVDRDYIEHDPSASIRKAKIGGRIAERDRVLSEEEIVLLHQMAPLAGLLITSEIAIWIALSTCCRIGELMAARWEHINFLQKTWLIPAENSKNGKAHRIFLSDFAADCFHQLRYVTGRSQWCYPNASYTAPVNSTTVTIQLRDRQLAPGRKVLANRSVNPHGLLLPGGRWTPHDLRRTGATLMTALGVLPEVAERCLNHIEENRLKRIYQRHNYQTEMTNAWKVLGQRLQELTGRLDAQGQCPEAVSIAGCDAAIDSTGISLPHANMPISQASLQPPAGGLVSSDLLTLAEVARLLKRSRTVFYELRCKDPSFPKPITNGNNRRSRVYFVRQEVESYLRTCSGAPVGD